MGAYEFTSHSELADVAEAFAECREVALWEYGHGGYTGTIAEKSDWVVLDLPDTIAPDDAVAELHDSWLASWERPSWLPEQIVTAYNDKWGPAVAMRDRDQGGWIFIGWAST